MNETYIITGACGFIGSHLSSDLLRQGYRVIGIDDFSSASPLWEGLLDYPNFTQLTQDVTEGLGISQLSGSLLGRVRGVFHLASPASPVDYVERQLDTLRAGSRGTENALKIATQHRARFVLASTSEVYGDPEIHPQPEEYAGNVNPVGPRSMYDEAKRFSEALTMAYARERGANVGICRIFNTYGPGMREDDGRLVPTFFRQALAGEPLTIHGDGSHTRSLCYVDDTVRGLRLLMESTLRSPVNIGSEEELTVRTLAEKILRVTGSSVGCIQTAENPEDPKQRRPSIRKAQELLGWTPTTSVEAGLRLVHESLAVRELGV